MHQKEIRRAAAGMNDAPIDRDVALKRLLDLVQPLDACLQTLDASLGMRLAGDAFSPLASPPFNQAAMDGFAIRSADTAGASPSSPVMLPVLRAIAAGDVEGEALAAGHCVRLMTGGPLPASADAVIELEAVDLDPSTGLVVITHYVSHGRNVRWLGEHVSVGDKIATEGDIMTPARVGFLASSGTAEVLVRRRPRVALIVTGAEIVAVSDARTSEQIFDALTPMIGGYIRAVGGDLVACVRASDDPVAMRVLFSRIIREERPDLIVSTAGIAAGDRDVMRIALDQYQDVQFVQLRMKPGRLLAYGRIAHVPFIGLPGNPIAAAVSFLQFTVQVIDRLAGRIGPKGETCPVVMARSVADLSPDPDRDCILCGELTSDDAGQLQVSCIGSPRRQGLRSLADANCLIVMRRGDHAIAAGSVVEAIRLPLR
jgi:molybdopterin molybdotransferase